jgi:hypothetical protein
VKTGKSRFFRRARWSRGTALRSSCRDRGVKEQLWRGHQKKSTGEKQEGPCVRQRCFQHQGHRRD